MRIAIFSPYATVAPHFETELEIAQQHLDRGDLVSFVNCMGELPNCDFNPEKKPIRCQECKGRRIAGLDLLSPAVDCRIYNGPHELPAELMGRFETVQQLCELQMDGFDIGYAALSSLVSQCRDPEPDLVKHRDLVKQFLASAWRVYRATLEFIHQCRPDCIYVFNGRFASMRAVLRACQKMGTDCRLHERGCDGQHYELFHNHLPHDIRAVDKLIRHCWDAAGVDGNREQIGSSWFLDRVNRVERNWHSFVKKQQTGLLPANWDSQRNNVAIYCSSDDEFVAIGDCWENSLYPNQVAAIAQIAKSLKLTMPETCLYLRVHPNLEQVDNQRSRQMLALDFDNLHVIPPKSPVDTYQLLRACDCAVSFGSSVGIEAVFWERPSVLLGPCLYQHLDGTYQSASHEQTVDLLSRKLAPQTRLGALMYGHWLQTRGHRYQYYEATSLFEGKFKGTLVYGDPPRTPGSSAHRLKMRIRRMLKWVEC